MFYSSCHRVFCESTSLRGGLNFFFFGDTLTSACRMTSVSRLKRWRWHGNAVARAPALVLCGVTAGRCYERHRCAGGSCWQERMHRQGWQRRDECVCVCVCVCVWRCLHCVCVCVKVCREVRQELKHNVRCVCLFWGVSACVCRGICMNTCQHARVCVCVCVCVCVWGTGGFSVSNMSAGAPGWRLCDPSSVGPSEHRHSDETKHATCWAAFTASGESAGRSASPPHLPSADCLSSTNVTLSSTLLFSTMSTHSFNLVALTFFKKIISVVFYVTKCNDFMSILPLNQCILQRTLRFYSVYSSLKEASNTICLPAP